MKPNYKDLGLSGSMGPKLRQEVERQLLRELEQYHSFKSELRFDWSESCIEGKCLHYLDGSLDRFSGISIFNEEDEIVAEGWMEFIYLKEKERLIVYWEFLDLYIDGSLIEMKSDVGIPKHIRNQMEEE